MLQEVDRNVRVVYERAHGVVVADKIVEENQFSSRVSAIGDQNKRAFKRREQREKAFKRREQREMAFKRREQREMAFKRREQREKASGLTAGAKRR